MQVFPLDSENADAKHFLSLKSSMKTGSFDKWKLEDQNKIQTKPIISSIMER